MPVAEGWDEKARSPVGRWGKEFAGGEGAGAEVRRWGAGAGSQATGQPGLAVPTGAPQQMGPGLFVPGRGPSARSNVTAGPRAGVRWAGPDLSCDLGLQGLQGL